MRRLMAALVLIGAAGLLAGCTASAPDTPPSAVIPDAEPTTTTIPTSSTPAASASRGSAAPTSSSAPTGVSSQQGGGKGCSPNGVSIPAGADTAPIRDVDETDSDATEFSSETPRFEFGVHTTSGATIVLPDDLAGPATHSGWMTRLPLAVVAVLDDGREATLHAFVDCRFVQTEGVDGKPYSFALNGFGTAGTGVGCASYADGTTKLLGLNAVRLPTGRYRIDSTEVQVSTDGRTATNGATTKGTTTYAAGNAQVQQANSSTCGDVPIVHTSGR